MKKLFLLTCLLIPFLSLHSFAGLLPDTGQTKCYNNTVEITCPQPSQPFYGQDASYTCNPHSYTDLGNGIVRDNITGLEWQKATALGDYNWSEAITYCDNLILGGYSDWRLPTIKELSTLVDSSLPDPGPTINTTFFPGTVAAYYWSSTTSVYSTGLAWEVDFGKGYVGSSYKTDGLYARAVRGGPLPNNNFIDNGDGTVSDTITGLMWQKVTVLHTYWEQAITYCENLTLPASNGYSDWRLPNRNELQSIVDYTRYDPSIDTTVFSDTFASATYWSSTTGAGYNAGAWYVGLGSGGVGYFTKGITFRVRAVRGGSFGDSECDGILEDGDNNTVVGDNPCTRGETVNCDDNCINTPNPDQADTDNDTVGDLCDNCPNDSNTNQSDLDGDGIGNVCDICPNDPENDIDNDTICGDVDICPNDPDNGCLHPKIEFDYTGDGQIDTSANMDASQCGTQNLNLDIYLTNWNAEHHDHFVFGVSTRITVDPTYIIAFGLLPDSRWDADFSFFEWVEDGVYQLYVKDLTCSNSVDPSGKIILGSMLVQCAGPIGQTSITSTAKLADGNAIYVATGGTLGSCSNIAPEDGGSGALNINIDMPGCNSNINGDTTVNVFDLIILKNEYNRTGCIPDNETFCCKADITEDGNVNVFDLIEMKNGYNISGCALKNPPCVF